MSMYDNDNRYVVDDMLIEKAFSEDCGIVSNVLCKFFQNNSKYRLCMDGRDKRIYDSYFKVVQHNAKAQLWLDFIANNISRIVFCKIGDTSNVFLSVAKGTSRQLITSDKEHYHLKFKSEAKQIRFFDEYEAAWVMSSAGQNEANQQVINGNGNIVIYENGK